MKIQEARIKSLVITKLEVNFGIGSDVEKKKEKQRKMISQIDARMISRFMKGTYLPTLNIIISSKDSSQSFLDSYINTKRQNESKTTLIVDEPQWVVRNDKGSPEDTGAFYVAIGNKFLANELLPVDADETLVDSYHKKGYRLLKVPPGYREAFEDNLEQALMDQAGISMSDSTKYLSGVRLEQAKTIAYRNPFTRDIIKTGNSPDDYVQYSDFFDLSCISEQDLACPMFIHLDLSLSGDKTGIAGVWITGKQPDIPGQDSAMSMRYKLAFVTSIEAPKGYQVSFEKTRNFIKWLRDKDFAIKGISADTYNSATLLQELKAAGFNTNILSVDRCNSNNVCEPYAFLKTAIYERKVDIFSKCDLLTEELLGLERLSSGKIDHTPDGINSKDSADAFCGALFSASKYGEEYAFNYGETLVAAFEANDISDINIDTQKQKFISDLESDLISIQKELNASANYQQSATDFAYFADLADGILVI